MLVPALPPPVSSINLLLTDTWKEFMPKIISAFNTLHEYVRPDKDFLHLSCINPFHETFLENAKA